MAETTEVSAQSIRNEFTVDDCGIIRNPGKFEGEHFSAPYFYALLMDGFADIDDDGAAIFDVSDAERQAFDLGATSQVVLRESDCGFISCEWL